MYIAQTKKSYYICRKYYEMSLSRLSLKYYSIFVVIAIGLAVICYIIMINYHDDTNEKIYQYSSTFSDSHIGGRKINKAQRELLKDASSNLNNDSLFYNDMRKFGRLMFEQGDQIMAFEYLSQIAAIIETAQRPNEQLLKYKAYCYLLLGASADETGLASLSHGYYLEAMKIADQIGSRTIKDDLYNNLGVSMYKSGNVEKADYFYNLALQGAISDRNNQLQSIVLNNKAEIYSDKHDLPKAIDYMLKAIHSIDCDTYPEDYYSLQATLGSLYLKQGDYPMAYACLTNAYRYQVLHDDKPFLFDTLMSLADYFNQQSLPDSASRYIDEARQIITNNPEQKIMLLDRESEMLSVSGNQMKAYEVAKQTRQMKDSLQNVENSYKIERAYNFYELDRKASKELSGISKWNPVVVFVSMSLVVLMLICFVTYIVILKRKTDKINEKKMQIVSELSDMKDRQLEEQSVHKEKQDEELRLFNQKLTSFTLERIKTNEQIEDITTEVKKALLNVPPRDKNQQALLKEVIRKMDMLQSDSQWEEFQYYFEKVHPDFYSRLDDRHHDLTAKERRLCALLSLGLSTKDIAAITNLEVRSVESSRNRLRKKLGLKSDQNLFDYIRAI